MLQVYFITQLQHIFKLQCMNWVSSLCHTLRVWLREEVEVDGLHLKAEKVWGLGRSSFSCAVLQEGVVLCHEVKVS